MATAEPKPPSYSEIIASLLRPLQGPIALDNLVEQTLQLHPSQARNPRQAVLQHIREAQGEYLVRPDPKTILPLHLAFQGVRFRLQLDREIATTGLLEIENNFHSYLPRNFPLQRLSFVDKLGYPIPFDMKSVTHEVDTYFGKSHYTQQHIKIGQWFRAQKMYAKDHLLVTILDWENGVFQLEREPASSRNQTLLRQRNQELANILWNLLEAASDEVLYARIAVPTAYALLLDKNGYPPDHWQVVIEEDERMESDGVDIRYSDGPLSMFEVMIRRESGERISVPPEKFSREQGQKIYRLKAELVYNPKIWRKIEIQGKQTLGDLDEALRSAFNHDPYDHLGGFWKLIPRGTEKSRRYREVDLGEIYPFHQGGEAAKTGIAAVSLGVGEKIKYVYDFGDWVEHILTLESIEGSQQGIKYPREVERNQPQYEYCVECQKKGKETIAEWMCLSCSNTEGKEILLCKRCVRRHEDDHYVDEIIY
jgi:hypothetical protein